MSKSHKRRGAEQPRVAQPLTAPTAKLLSQFPVLDDFFAYEWKNIPLRHAYGAYALCLYANLPDYSEVATESLTEGTNDKDCDLCLIDTEAGVAFIVQATVTDKWNQTTASANKADDLLNALSWLMRQPYNSIPLAIRSKAKDLQEALSSKLIKNIHLLFVHNSQQSTNVGEALETVAMAAKKLVDDQSVTITVQEIGLPRLQHLYNSLTKQIVVEEKILFSVQGVLEENGEGWSAIQTTIDGGMLHDLWNQYKDDLFSANIRGYLDMLSRKASVNHGILDTVTRVPMQFWAFNNGVTILTKSFAYKNKKVIATGVSVVNGAQTTGVLGNAPRQLAAACRIPCRFIKCGDSELVNEIIENNNTQNAIKAFDIRSNDTVQRRLQAEYETADITYLHRRQGAQRLNQSAIQAEGVAPFLAAFHGKFQIAIRQRRTIFEDRSTYGDVFPLQTSARHVLLIQSLSVALNNYKLELVSGAKRESLDEPDRAVNQFLQYSTSKLFVVGVMGSLAPLIAGYSIVDMFAWKVAPAYFKNTWRDTLVRRWKPLVESLVPLIVSQIDIDIKDAVRSNHELDKIARKVQFLIKSLKTQYDNVMSPIRDITCL